MKAIYKIIAGIVSMAFAANYTNPGSTSNNVGDEESTEIMTLYTTDWLRVREEPSLDARIIDVYAPGTEIIGVGVSNGWVKMKYGTQHEYFMHSDWLTTHAPEKDNEDDTDAVESESSDNVSENDDSEQDISVETSDDVSEEVSEDDDSEEIVEDNKDYSDDDDTVYYTYTGDTDGEDIYDIGYPSYMLYSPDYFKENGVIEYDGYYYTYYSELQLPGEDLYIPGRWTDEYGFVRDGNGNLCLASNTPETMERFSTVYTPWGFGVIYDYGTGNDYVIDVYVAW